MGTGQGSVEELNAAGGRSALGCFGAWPAPLPIRMLWGRPLKLVGCSAGTPRNRCEGLGVRGHAGMTV